MRRSSYFHRYSHSYKNKSYDVTKVLIWRFDENIYAKAIEIRPSVYTVRSKNKGQSRLYEAGLNGCQTRSISKTFSIIVKVTILFLNFP